jgi:putative membrane protein
MKKVLLAALATLALAACGGPSTPDFVQRAAMSDMYEVEAGKIATAKGQSDQVKQFGQHMVEAHTQSSDELKGIVQAQNIKVDLPAQLDSKHQRMIDDLNNAAAGDFDKTYDRQQVDAHREAADLFKSYADKGDNQAVKQFAAKTLPVIQQHLQTAQQLPQ